MDKQHKLFVKYLELMQEQESIINELGKTNVKLIEQVQDLKKQKNMYKENAQVWKDKHDLLQIQMQDLNSRCTNIVKANIIKANAIRAYKEMQWA